MKEKKDNEQTQGVDDQGLIKTLELVGWVYEMGFDEGRSQTTMAFKDFVVEKSLDIKPDLEGFMTKFYNMQLKKTKNKPNNEGDK